MNGQIAIYVVAFIVVAVAFLFAIYQHEQRQRRVERHWQMAANELDGDLVLPATSSWWAPKPCVLTACVGKISLKVDHYEANGKNSHTFTRLEAIAIAPSDFKLQVSPSGLFSGLARAVGFQDVPTGDTAFDESFIVKSSDAQAAKLWLSPVVRKMLGEAPPATFTLEGGKLKAEVGRLLERSDELLALIHATAALADAGQLVVRGWSKLALSFGGTVNREVERWASMVLDFEGVPITVDTKKIDNRHYTFAHVHVLGRQLEPFVLAKDVQLYQGVLPRAPNAAVPEPYEVWAERPDVVVGVLDAQVRKLLKQIKPAKIRVERDDVEVLWDGVSMSRREIVRGMRLAAMLANKPGKGPYR